jgi:membrane protein implicated in regulation of membrane protease activity
MAESTIWWLLAGTAVAVELATGTFYLLMLSLGMVAAALIAHSGASFTVQMVAAALVGIGAVLVWRKVRRNRPDAPKASANEDVNMDIGQTVHVEQWQADGTATVKYRGAHWTVVHSPAPDEQAPPQVGLFKVVEVLGSRLMVRKA